MIGQEGRKSRVVCFPKYENGRISYSETYPCYYIDRKEVGKIESWKNWEPIKDQTETD